MNEKMKSQKNAKQVILVRKDLEMSNGKFGAMCAHASLGALFKCGLKNDEMVHIDLRTGDAVEQWLNGNFTKVILAVKSEEQLLKYFNQVDDLGLPCSLITDAGLTVFNGVPTHTAVGIGPVFPEEINHITKRLQLYK